MEVICFSLIIRHNDHQGNKYLTASNAISSNINAVIHSITQYLDLKETNEQLAEENARLRNEFLHNKHLFHSRYFIVNDTAHSQQYVYTAAKVVQVSTNKQKNFFTIDKGRKQGVKVDMAVISPNGVAGIVFDVSNNYSTVMSVINTNFKVSAKLKKSGYFGSLSWNGKNSTTVQLSEIPRHASVSIGDTVVSNTFSAIYPDDIPVGVVSEVEDEDGENFYNIQIDLLTDYQSMEFVYIINDLYKEERVNLENTLPND